MWIPPRYGADPVITHEVDPAAIAAPAIRQRQRLAATLAAFGPAEWSAPSRCEGWTNRDVVVHLVSTDKFWTYAIGAARRGAPTELLADFDPVGTPAGVVTALADLPPAKVLSAYARSADALAGLLGSLGADEWTLPAESPLGHVSVSAVARHALWDSWVHERDVALGVGLLPPVEADEVEAALRCVAALGPAFGCLLGELGDPPRSATIRTDDPAVSFTVHAARSVRVTASADPAAPVAWSGPALDVLEGLSLRAPLGLAPDHRWLTDGLTRSFDQTPAHP